MIFWLLVIAITFIIGGVAFYPLLKSTIKVERNQRDRLNKAFYFDRLQEVKNDLAEGVLDDPEQTKIELQQSLLEDIPEQTQTNLVKQKSFGKVWFITLILSISTISAGVYFQVGSWFTGTMLDMSHNKLDYFYERLKHEQTDPLSEQEMNQFTMALRVELQQKPEDDKSWFMLGQLGMATNKGDLAMDSFAKALKLQPENLQYKLSYAQILLFSEDKNDKDKGEQLLKEVIRLDHTNVDALGLLAFQAFEKQDYKMAVMTWGMMLKILPPDDPRTLTLERSIQAAQAMMNEESPPSPHSEKKE